MLTALAWLHVRRATAPYERAFIRRVVTRESIARNAWAEKLILAGWLVIVGKCLLVIWAINHWRVPFDPYWINIPTVLMAALATAVYRWRDRG